MVVLGRCHRNGVLPTALLLLAVLSGCSYLQSGEPGLRAPNYASPVGTNYWQVTCGPNKIYIDYNELDTFYNEDGSQKTYMEFCRETEASRIRRE